MPKTEPMSDERLKEIREAEGSKDGEWLWRAINELREFMQGAPVPAKERP